MAPIIAGTADITGLENRFILQLPAGDFWTTQRDLRQRMFASDVIGGTMMFRGALFTGGLRYPEANLAEDAAFLREAVRRDHRLAQLENLAYSSTCATAIMLLPNIVHEDRGLKPRTT